MTNVPRATPAEAAGVSVDDEIVALGDFRVRAEQLISGSVPTILATPSRCWSQDATSS